MKIDFLKNLDKLKENDLISCKNIMHKESGKSKNFKYK